MFNFLKRLHCKVSILLGTLGICCFFCNALAQEKVTTNTVPALGKEAAIPTTATQSPGEQLIEFMMNPPEKYDLGGVQIYRFNETGVLEGRKTFLRIKRDGDSRLFCAISSIES